MSIHKSNNKVTVTVTVSKKNIAQDVSSATTKQLFFRKPSGDTLTKSATFTSDGTDGKIYYQLLAADLDEVGKWTCQGHVVLTSGTYTTEWLEFQVDDNLVAI